MRRKPTLCLERPSIGKINRLVDCPFQGIMNQSRRSRERRLECSLTIHLEKRIQNEA